MSSKQPSADGTTASTSAAQRNDENAVLQGLEQRIRDLPNARATVSSKADDRRTNSVQEATSMSSDDVVDATFSPRSSMSSDDVVDCTPDYSLDRSKYELHDFDTLGSGEPIRLLFAYTNTPFEDVRITREQWAERKPTYKFGKLPVLKVDGKELAQSAVILRYLGEKFGLAGRGVWKKAKVHEVMDFHKDVMKILTPYFNKSYHGGDKTALRKVVFLPSAERLFPQYVRLLKKSGSGFFAPSGLTFVDFSVAVYFEHWTSTWEPEFMKENYPEIGAYVNKVYSMPQIKDYIKNRKD